ncbi:AMP-binding enzyme [Alicyclobacillus fructus]|uniref:AMP-binding enzyme n=1 Tax=Alicyclobacillus fructus TaxID=2816082 RepID=UPI002E2DB620|nr:hypothetical protein [Alicyclobacillus fructus]
MMDHDAAGSVRPRSTRFDFRCWNSPQPRNLLPHHGPGPPDFRKPCCRAELAPYKRPRRYYFVDSFPKTSTGKVLRRELRQMAAQA